MSSWDALSQLSDYCMIFDQLSEPSSILCIVKAFVFLIADQGKVVASLVFVIGWLFTTIVTVAAFVWHV